MGGSRMRKQWIPGHFSLLPRGLGMRLFPSPSHPCAVGDFGETFLLMQCVYQLLMYTRAPVIISATYPFCWHMWQSQLDIPSHISIAYRGRSAIAQDFIKHRAHTCYVDVSVIRASMQHVWALPLTEVLCYSGLNAVTQSKYAME